MFNLLLYSLPLPGSKEDNKTLAKITPDTAWLGIWLDVVVSETNKHYDGECELLDYVSDLNNSNQGIWDNNIDKFK